MTTHKAHGASKARKLVSPCSYDPRFSVSLFDSNRKNQSGEMYCVASGILHCQVDEEWKRYLGSL